MKFAKVQGEGSCRRHEHPAVGGHLSEGREEGGAGREERGWKKGRKERAGRREGGGRVGGREEGGGMREEEGGAGGGRACCSSSGLPASSTLGRVLHRPARSCGASSSSYYDCYVDA